jgi:dipeptidase
MISVMIKRTNLITTFRILTIVSASFLFANQGYAQVNDQSSDQSPDNCTSIMVGKLASTDGSTITSHTCDSRTDRTWVNLVPNMKYKKGTKTKVYFEPKNTTIPDQPNRKVTIEIPQVEETYAYLNAAYPIMNEYQLAIGESTFGGKRNYAE